MLIRGPYSSSLVEYLLVSLVPLEHGLFAWLLLGRYDSDHMPAQHPLPRSPEYPLGIILGLAIDDSVWQDYPTLNNAADQCYLGLTVR
jgi:hypothetical protein